MSDPNRPILLVPRLALLMFFGYAIMGAWFPVFTRYLQKSLEFAPEAAARACATNAIGALIAPLLWGQIADRWVAAERCISVCALANTVLLLLLAEARTPASVFWLSVGFWFFMIPILSLGTALTFRQLPHPEKDFGKVRLWGTVGWVVASQLLALWLWIAPGAGLVDSLRLGAAFAFIVAVYSLTMPHTPPARVAAAPGSKSFVFGITGIFDAPVQAVQLLRQPSFAVYCLCLFGCYMTMTFTTQMNPLLLRQLGVSDGLLPAMLTIAQSSEIVMLALLPVLLTRLRLKRTMVLGIVTWTAGLTALTWGRPLALVLIALASHGVYICCFLVVGQVFVNRQAGHAFRASAQGLIQLISGLGLLLGHLLVGWIRQQTGDDFSLAYAPAAFGAAGLVLLFVLGFAVRETGDRIA